MPEMVSSKSPMEERALLGVAAYGMRELGVMARWRLADELERERALEFAAGETPDRDRKAILLSFAPSLNRH